MSESPLHFFLKLMGAKFLHDLNCRRIAFEVSVTSWDLTMRANDYRRFIDVAGIGTKPIMEVDEVYPSGYKTHKKVGTESVLRGIEVKISRSDFMNGFITQGLDYIYILTPKGLLKKKEVPKGIGLLEYDSRTSQYDEKVYRFIRVVKPPRRKELTDLHRETLVNAILNAQYKTIMKLVRNTIGVLGPELEERENG